MTRGSCLCGTVQFEIDGKTTEIGMCHCSKCRKVSGVASNANLMVGRDRLKWISGEDHLTKFEMADGWGSLALLHLRVAGTQAPSRWRGLLGPGRPSRFDPGVRIAGHIFVGSKAPWDEIAGNAPQLRDGFGSERLN